MEQPALIELDWKHQYRIISSEYPPINFFEELVEPELIDELYYIESLTNDRLRDEAGDISLVAKEDRISGLGSSPVMAAFTHTSLNTPTRFSDGSYGIYYAAKTLDTAIEETKFHRAKFLAYTKEESGEIDMRVYIGGVAKPMHDIQCDDYHHLHDPHNWSISQAFGKSKMDEKSWGLVYNSVRDPGGTCIASLRPSSLTIPKQGPHLSYVWDGRKITKVYEKTRVK